MDNCSRLAFGKHPRTQTPQGPIILANLWSLGAPWHAKRHIHPAREMPRSPCTRVSGGTTTSPSLGSQDLIRDEAGRLLSKDTVVPRCQNNTNQSTRDSPSPVKLGPNSQGACFFPNLTRLIYLCLLQWLQITSTCLPSARLLLAAFVSGICVACSDKTLISGIRNKSRCASVQLFIFSALVGRWDFFIQKNLPSLIYKLGHSV